jgi:hypothetical protein
MTLSNQRDRPTSWKDQIVNNPKEDILITDSIDLLAQITPDKSCDDLATFAHDEEDCYILVKSFESNTCPVLLHHARITNGTRRDGDRGSKYFILHQGLSDYALPFKVEPTEIFKLVPDIPKYSYESLFAAKSLTEIDNLEPINTTSKQEDIRAGLIIPHFIAREFIQSEATCAKSFISTITNFIAVLEDTFDVPTESEEGTLPDENNVETFIQVLTWLRHFESSIPTTPLTPILQGTRLSIEDSRFQRGFIYKLSEHQSPASQLTSVRNITTDSESTLAIQSSIASNIERISNKFEDNDTKSKSFAKCPNLTRKTLLAFATSDCLNPASKLHDSGLEIMKQRNDTDAHQLLHTTLQARGLFYATLSIANAKDICNGRWVRQNFTMPEGLSVLLIQTYDPNSGHSLTRDAMILLLKTKHSIDDEAISKLIDTDIALPTNFEGMMENIKVVHGIIKVFAPDSWPAKCYDSLILDLVQIEKDCKRLIHDDKSFITKILSDIDNRTSRFLDDCRLRHNNFEQIRFSFLNMRDIAEDIQSGKYSFNAVPACIKSFSAPSDSKSTENNPHAHANSRSRSDRNSREKRQR